MFYGASPPDPSRSMWVGAAGGRTLSSPAQTFERFILRKKILFRAYDGSSRPNVSP